MTGNERSPRSHRGGPANITDQGQRNSGPRRIDGASLLPAALAYARRGWHVFPLRRRGKVPANMDGFKSATTDASKIERYWTANPEANIGLATGSISSLFVIDVDQLHALDQLQERHGVLPETLSAETGSGGRHLFFEHPGHEIRNRAGFVPGLDVRGDGGYVVVAPSVHPNGKPYRWNTEKHPALAPGWLIELVRTPPVPPRVASPQRSFVGAGIGTRWGEAALEGELKTLVSAVEGERNDTLFRVAANIFGAAKGGELDADSARRTLEHGALSIGLTATETRRTLDSAYRAAEPRGPERRRA